MNKIIIICGPTGIGKTSFSISLSNRFNGEIIGADSMQIYKYLDIGTAKPDIKERNAAVHHLVDFLDPKDNFDAGQYVKMADTVINDLFQRNKLPIVAGGTGLYIKALLNGLFRSRSACEKTMLNLDKVLKEKGHQYLYQKLIDCDLAAAQRIHPHDTFRVIRALEYFHTTGQKISNRQTDHNFKDNRYKYLKIGLKLDRKILYDRINSRVDIMLNSGLLNEVTNLMNKGYPLSLKAMQSIGYKHMGMFINQEIDWPEVVRLLKRDTRRYAKRQFTWFNKDKEIHWLEPKQINQAIKLIKEFLT